jgi:hypothetical protein
MNLLEPVCIIFLGGAGVTKPHPPAINVDEIIKCPDSNYPALI